MIVLLWILNFGISWLNAWGCGKTWNETRANGGFPHFMNWCGAIMSASGFTWCYLLVLGFLGSSIPFDQEVNGIIVSEPYLTGAALQAFADLGYMVIIFPILGSGLAITLHSWGVAWRQRSFGNTAVAGWNTFAMGTNIYDAVTHVPAATSRLGGFFEGNDDDATSGFVKLTVVVLVAIAILGGVLTTRQIILSTMRTTAMNRRFQYAERF